MPVADLAGLIAALAFVALVAFLAVPLLKLGRVLDEARGAVHQLTEHTLPAVDEAVQTVRAANGQLAKVDTITTSAARATEDLSALTTLLTATVGGPLIKVSAASYAARRAVARLRGR